MERGSARLTVIREERVAVIVDGAESITYVPVDAPPMWAQELPAGMGEAIDTGTTVRMHAATRLRFVRGRNPREFSLTDRLRADDGRVFEIQQIDRVVNGQPYWVDLSVVEVTETVPT